MPRTSHAPTHTANGHARGVGVRVQDLLDETAVTSVAVGGLTVSVTYRVLWEEQFSEDDWTTTRALTGRDYFLEVIPRLCVRWDLLDEAGLSIGVNRAAIEAADVPTRFLRLVEEAVMQASALGKGNSASSGVTSPPVAGSE